MQVLIVSRTRMGARRCIGGIARNDRPVRLLTETGANQEAASALRIGDVWEVDYRARPNLRPPHVEDVLCAPRARVKRLNDLNAWLRKHVPIWRGGVDGIFEGRLRFTASRNGYVSQRTGLPGGSTGFWVPNRDLTLRDDRRHYDYPLNNFAWRSLSYVGEPEPVATITAGTLVRVSLARWWKPDDVDMEERCYLQLSGWY